MMGICAAMPPMACTPRLWHVLISRCTYDAMKGVVIVTSPRCGSTNCAGEVGAGVGVCGVGAA